MILDQLIVAVILYLLHGPTLPPDPWSDTRVALNQKRKENADRKLELTGQGAALMVRGERRVQTVQRVVEIPLFPQLRFEIRGEPDQPGSCVF